MTTDMATNDIGTTDISNGISMPFLGVEIHLLTEYVLLVFKIEISVFFKHSRMKENLNECDY